MPSTQAIASFKKQDGSLIYDGNTKTITWTSLSNRSNFAIEVANITNLQQTPSTSAKVALKISAAVPPANEAEHYVFNFINRADQETVTSALRNAITVVRATGTSNAIADPQTSNGINGSSGTAQPAALAIAQAVRSDHRASEGLYDDKRLISNGELQQSLLMKDPSLKQRFEQSLREKPESISLAQFGTQFWSSRMYLLRAHAIERNQTQGTYNVLAEIKETNVDGSRKLSLTKEHIQALFKQHPIIKHVYNETVPTILNESEFWARFFNSRLLRKLKGEPITDAMSSDHVLDKYLNTDEAALRNRQAAAAHIPHFIDLEGNEQNHSQKKGNQPDWTMRPEASGKAPLLHILNDMSERLMANVTPADGDAHAPIGMDENTFQQLRLQDLQAETEEDRVVLNIKERQHLFGGSKQPEDFNESRRYAKLNPTKVLASLIQDMSRDLALEASSEELKDTSTSTSQILSLISQQRDLASNQAQSSNLSAEIWQSLMLTHNTTSEFLHYFWTLLQSNASSSSSKNDFASVYGTLTKSLERIAAVAENAENERKAKIAEMKKSAFEYQSMTGKKRKFDESMVTVGGKKEVQSLMGPTMRALEYAQERYAAAFQE